MATDKESLYRGIFDVVKNVVQAPMKAVGATGQALGTGLRKTGEFAQQNQEGIQQFSEALQQIGVGVGQIEGKVTQAQALKAQQDLQKLRQGRAGKAAQKRLAEQAEKAGMIPGATEEFKVGADGKVSKTIKPPKAQFPQYVYDSETGEVSKLLDESGNVIMGDAKVMQRKKATDKTAGGNIQDLTPQQLITDMANEKLMADPIMKKTLTDEFLRRHPEVTKQEIADMRKPGWKKNMETFLKMFPAGPSGLPTIGQVGQAFGGQQAPAQAQGQAATPVARVKMITPEGEIRLVSPTSIEEAKRARWKLA